MRSTPRAQCTCFEKAWPMLDSRRACSKMWRAISFIRQCSLRFHSSTTLRLRSAIHKLRKKTGAMDASAATACSPSTQSVCFRARGQPLDGEERQEWHLSGHEELPQMCNRPLIGLADKTAMSRGQAKDINAAQHGQRRE